MDKHTINYDLASDRNLKGAVSFGLAYNASKLYSDMIDVLEEYSDSKSHILPVPAAFIVDTTGIIRFEYINPDATIRISPNLLFSAAKFSLNVDKKKE